MMFLIRRAALVVTSLLICNSLAFGAEFVPVSVESVDLAGSPYLSASGTLAGTFEREDGTDGVFEVPAEALFPLTRCNGTGVVDVLNSVLFEFPPTDELGRFILPFGRLFLGDDLIAGRGSGEGFTYIAVQWDKLVADESGVGLIERGTDGWAVLAGAADFLREADDDAEGLVTCEIERVLGFGWSQSGKLLAHLLTSGSNERPSGPIFDGLFLGAAGGRCRDLIDEALPWSYHDCDEPPVGHVPTLAYNTESEIQLSFGVGALRTPTANLSVYDHAGVAHIDSQFLPFAIVFADLADALGLEFAQNPVSVIPGVRAAFWALHGQLTEGWTPPRSRLLHAAPVGGPPVLFQDRRGDPSLLSWSGGAVYSADADGDGIADGGVRMPHMPTTTNGGQVVGAPLGLYGGIDFRFAGGAGIFFANGGSFAPFSEAELETLYPSHGTYVRRVVTAVTRLVLDRYLLLEDGLALIEVAVQSEVGR